MEKLLETSLEIESFITSVERKGVPFREFVALRQANRYPRYQEALAIRFNSSIPKRNFFH